MHLLSDPKRGPYVEKAINSQDAALQGPFKLRQGGVGIVVRYPIYRDGVFLGLTIGVYDLEPLINEALQGIDDEKYTVTLRNHDEVQFWTSGTDPEKYIDQKVTVADRYWTVLVGWSQSDSVVYPTRVSLWIIGLCFVLFLFFAMKYYWRQEARLANTVNERTKELKQANQHLRESEEKYHLAMEATSDGIWDWNISDNTVFYSDGWEKMLHIKAVPAVYESWSSRIHLDDREKVLSSLTTHLEGETDQWEQEHRLKTDGEDYKWVLGRGKVVERDPQNRPQRMVGTMTDITRRKVVEDQLISNLYILECLSKVDRIIRQGNDATIVMGNILEEVLDIFQCDRAWLVFPCDPDAEFWTVPYERTRAEFPGASTKNEKHPMTPQVAADMRELVANDILIYGSHGTEKPEYDLNDEFSVKSYLASAIFPKGHTPWEFGIHQCCHERSWTKQELHIFKEIKLRVEDSLSILLLLADLKKSEERFKTVIEKSPLPMVITDENQDILFFNEKFTDEFGYTINDIKTSDQWWETAYPNAKYRERVQKSWLDAIEKAKADNTDLKMQQWNLTIKDGSKRLCEFYMVPMDKFGVIVIKDTTEQKKVEERLQLAQRIESIGTLAGGIAHDFNNILTPIVGISELLMDGMSKDSQTYEDIEEILRAGKRGSDLVKQILAFSRKTEHQTLPIRIQQIVKEVLKLSRATIPSNIEITHDIREDCGTVKADPTQIHQVIMNVITNAYHAVGPEGGKIDITLDEIEINDKEVLDVHSENNRYVCLSISDNGIGMSPDIKDKIFEPYFTTKEKGKGTGLGLAVAYGIIKEHQGDIKIYSEENKGSTFHIYLPLIDKKIEPLEHINTPSSFQGNEHIMVVDDEQPIARLVHRVLDQLGYKVTSFNNSLDALKIFKNDPFKFDLLITDMTMPGMTGDQLAAELKQIRPEIPVIVCTGFSEKISKDMAPKLGIEMFLMKPIIKSELARAIRETLDSSG